MFSDGQLIVIDGIDSDEINHQIELLRQHLINKGAVENKDFIIVGFPRYSDIYSRSIERNLEEGFSDKEIEPKLASTFYALDRAYSFKNDDWGRIYKSGGIIITDRYTTSSIIYQGAKLFSDFYMDNFKPSSSCNISTIHGFANWLYNLEYKDLRLPIPDKVIWLNKSEVSDNLKAHKFTLDAYKSMVTSNVYILSKLSDITQITEQYFINTDIAENIHKCVLEAVEDVIEDIYK